MMAHHDTSRKGLAIFILIFVGGSLIVTGLYFASQDSDEVRLAYLRGDIHHLPFLVALNQGWYEDANNLYHPFFEKIINIGSLIKGQTLLIFV